MKSACQWVRARLTRFRDGELPENEQTEVERHLDACADCRAQHAALGRADDLIQAASTERTARGAESEEDRSFETLRAAMRQLHLSARTTAA